MSSKPDPVRGGIRNSADAQGRPEDWRQPARVTHWQAMHWQALHWQLLHCSHRHTHTHTHTHSLSLALDLSLDLSLALAPLPPILRSVQVRTLQSTNLIPGFCSLQTLALASLCISSPVLFSSWWCCSRIQWHAIVRGTNGSTQAVHSFLSRRGWAAK